MTDRILIIDFGSQVTQLIARRVRESGVYSEIVPFNKAEEILEEFNPKGIILSGGPNSVYDIETPRAPEAVFDMGVPVLGICYGEQTMCEQMGGKVEASDEREFGRAYIDIKEDSPLFEGFWNKGTNHQVWMSHGDKIDAIPTGFKVIATSGNAPYAAIANEEKQFYGVQFHPEVVHTLDGAKLLNNFVKNIVGCTGDWTMASFRETEIAKIREQVG
ncbi:MAG: glutamine-hydrolyzing GMP synthase, partial [Emcibacteraceae bacterium]|nr:glutamine-hydrolyzing GMP synthase [Emcibacteraceae bacterium]